MAESNNIKYMKIHFTWINWSLETRKNIRERIIQATENERIEIAKHIGLDNAFLIKRMKDVVFQNLIYYRILTNKKVFHKIMPKVTEILSKNITYAEEITELLKEEALKANLIYPLDDYFEKMSKIGGTNEAAIEYLQLLLKYYMKIDDLENFANVRSYLEEYITSIFRISKLFQSTFIYSGNSFALKHEFAAKSFLIENVYNYLFYENLSSPHQDFITQLSSLFSYPLKAKLRTLAFQILDLEWTQETLSHYPIFFNHLLSIASMLYFIDLTLDEKLELLNHPYELDDLITLLQNYDFEWDFINWKFSSTYLLNAGLYELALQLNEIMLENHFDRIRNEDKYFLYDGLGTIHRNLGNHDKACKYYQEAYKWLEKARLTGISLLSEDEENQIFNVKKDYQRGICLKNIGECYGHQGNNEEMIKKFLMVEKVIKDLENNSEKYNLYMNLSIASRRLCNFEEERNFINKALEFIDESIPLQQVEQRIEIFDETEMSFEKLMQIEIKEKINNYIIIGKFLNQVNNHKLSIGYYNEALKVSEEVKELNQQRKIRINIFRGMAISYFLARDWRNSKLFLEKYFALEKDFESELYYFIVLYLTEEFEEAKNNLIELVNKFKESSNHLMLINDWLIQIMNTLGKKKFLEFVNMIKTLNDELQEFIFFHFGNALADNGFSELALQFFERELNFIKDDKKKATIFNDIGGVYSDLDDYGNAIYNFKKALKLDKEFDLCYRNLADIYSRKLDNVRAKKSIIMAIDIAKKKGKQDVKIYEEELEQINQMIEDVFNINDISSTDIINILKTTEKKLIDYRKESDDFDASDIILGYSKALERILNERVAIHFKPLVKKYKQTKKQTSEDFNKKFGLLFQQKTISLGTWSRIFKDFENERFEPDVEEYRDHLKSKFSNIELNQLRDICQLIVEERNEIAHTKVLNINQVREIRKKIVAQFNLIIRILF